MKRAAKHVVPVPQQPTREPTEREHFERFVRNLCGAYAIHRNLLVDFGAKFVNPTGFGASNALEWSDSAFKSAAMCKVYEEVLRAVWKLENTNEPLTVAKVREYATNQVVRKAEYPQRSTSVASNLIAQETLSVWAYLLSTLGGYES
jgi:hypothetical protein